MSVKVVLSDFSILRWHDISILKRAIKISFREIGGTIESWDDHTTGKVVYKCDTRPRDIPIMGLFWEEIER